MVYRYIVLHQHNHGTSFYQFTSQNRELDLATAEKAVGDEFESDNGEYLEIFRLDDSEWQNID